MDQDVASRKNREVWTDGVYDAWCRFMGTPEQAAARRSDPRAGGLRRHLPLLGEVAGSRIANLMGFNGRRAIPLAQLGARVTVVDISEANARYALEYAAAAQVNIDFIVSDLFTWDIEPFRGTFDTVYLEGGVLHWCMALAPVVAIMRDLLDPGGRLVLSDFHPIRRCIPEPGVPVTEDYFDTSPQPTRLPLDAEGHPRQEMRPPDGEAAPGVLRRWRLDQIVTAVAEHGFRIRALHEEPATPGDLLPGYFSLLAFRD